MSASGFTPIQLYRTTTAAAVPTAGNLAAGELAINLTDEALYFKNTAGAVTLLADSSGALGSVTSVNASGGTTGLTFTGGPVTTSGTLTLGGTLAVANGGTGVTTSTGTGGAVLSNSPTLVTPVLGAASATSIANGLGAIGTPSYTFAGDLNTGMWSPAADTVAFSTVGSERLRVDSAGNVGIGTNSPGTKLDVNGTTRSGNFRVTAFGSVTGAGIWGTDAILAFNTDSAERMRIDASGNVGIGTATPSVKLDVVGAVRATGGFSSSSTTTFQPQTSMTNYASDATGGYYIFYKGRAGGATSQSGDTLGTLLWYGHDTGNTATSTSSIYTTQTAAAGAGSVPTAMVFTNGGNAERMRIDNGGNVGIGTNSPSALLDVNGAARANSLTLTTDLAIADGGTGASTASAARTNLGATTVGGNLFTLINPSAITFPRFNGDNTVSALNAADFRTAIGVGTGTGTVTSVGGTGTVNGITLTGTVTSSGNLTLGGTLSGVSLTTQVSGTLPIANGGTGSTATTFCSLTTNVTGTLPVGNGGTGATTLSGVVIGNGTSAFTAVTAPSGTIVGTTDTQNLTNKTLTTGNVLDAGTSVSDTGTIGVSSPGFRGLPQVATTTNRTLALTDAGKDIYISGTTAAQTVTIPANGTVAFPAGSMIQITNDSNQNWSIAITTDTLLWSPNNTTGTRTLAAAGQVTIRKVSATRWWISGVGLT